MNERVAKPVLWVISGQTEHDLNRFGVTLKCSFAAFARDVVTNVFCCVWRCERVARDGERRSSAAAATLVFKNERRVKGDSLLCIDFSWRL